MSAATNRLPAMGHANLQRRHGTDEGVLPNMPNSTEGPVGPYVDSIIKPDL